MQLSIGLPTFAAETHRVPSVRLGEYAEKAEDYGFGGAWLIDHLLPTPTYASSLLDPLTTLASIAGRTDTLPLGTSILILPLRHPVWVAKRAATLQHLSEGRLTLGLGAGYVEAEFDAVGVPTGERSARFREGIELLRALLNEDTVTFDGEFYAVDEFHLEPSTPLPPRILTGGGGVDTPDGRIVRDSVTARLRHADGWIAPPRETDILASDWAAFEGFLESQDRDPTAVDKVLLQYLHLVPGTEESQVRRAQRKVYRQVLGPDRPIEYALEQWLTGTVDEIRSTLETYESQGFDEVILHPMTTDPAGLERQLRLYRDELLTAYP